jgi:hypothetical protein
MIKCTSGKPALHGWLKRAMLSFEDGQSGNLKSRENA